MDFRIEILGFIFKNVRLYYLKKKKDVFVTFSLGRTVR